jgi:hypothetical protein
MNKYLLIYCIITIIVQSIIIVDLLIKRVEKIDQIIEQPDTTELDGLYNKVDTTLNIELQE